VVTATEAEAKAKPVVDDPTRLALDRYRAEWQLLDVEIRALRAEVAAIRDRIRARG